VTILKPCEQFRFPRSKKVRMRKKWKKNPANWRDKPYQMFHTHYVKPDSKFLCRTKHEMPPACKGGSDGVLVPMIDRNSGKQTLLQVSRKSRLFAELARMTREPFNAEPACDFLFRRTEHGIDVARLN